MQTDPTGVIGVAFQILQVGLWNVELALGQSGIFAFLFMKVTHERGASFLLDSGAIRC
jgi:hypothetical protein